MAGVGQPAGGGRSLPFRARGVTRTGDSGHVPGRRTSRTRRRGSAVSLSRCGRVGRGYSRVEDHCRLSLLSWLLALASCEWMLRMEAATGTLDATAPDSRTSFSVLTKAFNGGRDRCCAYLS